MLNRRCATGLITAIALLGGTVAAHAQSYPAKPIRWVVPYPAGGGSDFLARTIGQQLSQQISQPVTVDNKPGGNTAIAASEVARSAADGYTILSADNGTMVFNTALYSKLTYNPEKDLTPVTLMGRFPMILVVGPNSDVKDAKDFVAKLYGNVPVLDTGARGSTITFAQRNQGDVLIAWENEAYLLEKEFGAKFDVIAPSISILAEPAVSVVDKNVDKKGTRTVAEAYLTFLYTEEGQDIAGKHFYRPAVSDKAKAKYAKQFPKLNLFTINDAFGGWDKAAKDHFADNASFDQIYTKK